MAGKPKPVAGSEEHLALVRAPLLKQIEDMRLAQESLSVEVKGLEAQLDKVNEHAAQQRAELRLTQKQRDEAREQLNGLKAVIRQSELDRERLRGYLQAVRDAHPPKMVEAERVSHLETLTLGHWQDHVYSAPQSGYGTNDKRRPLWEL